MDDEVGWFRPGAKHKRCEMIFVSHLSTQWAAEMTCVSEIRLPPQKEFPLQRPGPGALQAWANLVSGRNMFVTVVTATARATYLDAL